MLQTNFLSNQPFIYSIFILQQFRPFQNHIHFFSKSSSKSLSFLKNFTKLDEKFTSYSKVIRPVFVDKYQLL